MRKYAVLFAIPLLLSAACRSTDSDDATTGSTKTAAPADDGDDGSTDTTVIEDDRAPGVTDDSVKVGITYVDFEALGDQVNIDHGDYEAAYMAVIDDINEDGGIHGRMIEPIFAPVNPASPVSTDETCTRLTQDEQVFVAIGNFFGEAVTCFVDINETAVIGGEMTDERLAVAKAPWFTLDPGADSQVQGLQNLIDAGEIEGAVAVVLADADKPLYDDRIRPMLEAAGIEPAEIYYFDTAVEIEQQQAATDAALARIEAAGAETILALGQAGPQVVANRLQAMSYRPKLVFSNLNGALAFLRGEGVDTSVLAGSVSAGPYDQDAMLELGGPTGECFDLQRAAGLTLTPPSQVPRGEPNQFVSSNIACQQLGLLRAILEAAGEELSYGTFQTAGYNLGEVVLPSSPEPFFYGPPPAADGEVPMFRYEFDVEAQEFQLVDQQT